MSVPTGGPPPSKDKYQLLEEEYHRTRDELKQARGELRQASQLIGNLQHENQRFNDSITGFELNIVHQQQEDFEKKETEVRGNELFGALALLAKTATLSISKVGEKVTALNEEIFQAAAALGEAFPQVLLSGFCAAAAESQETVGEKLKDIAIANPHWHDPNPKRLKPEVDPLLVQIVFQIFMVNFCVSKIQSWRPGDYPIESFLAELYSEIRCQWPGPSTHPR